MFKKCFVLFVFIMANAEAVPSDSGSMQHSSTCTRKEPCEVCGSMQAANEAFAESKHCSLKCFWEILSMIKKGEQCSDTQRDSKEQSQAQPLPPESEKENESKKQTAQPPDSHQAFNAAVFGGRNMKLSLAADIHEERWLAFWGTPPASDQK